MIWFAPINIEEIKSQAKGTLSEHLGMELVEIGPDYISGTMPVDSRTKQS